MTLDLESLKYSREHEWVSVDDDDVAAVGITDYAQEQLGDVVYVDLPETGSHVTQHEKFGEIESVKSVSDLFSPIGGEVMEVNLALEDGPEGVNEEPYGSGWMLKIKMDDRRELDSLLSQAEYTSLLAESEQV
ncbi:MAG: glycine cleavage system protein GcvH [Dehalococcoidia bacterium]|jgi:glycine cleavage system H protein|nr:glycine cleavage system protein GcvH [Dehalococcoidia bacterium]